MPFEYDPQKSAKNLDKHGISFEDAQRLWESPYVVVPSAGYSEKRYIVLGVIDGKNWTAAITYRNGNVRIISVRRSRKKEVQVYERCTQDAR